MACFSPTGVDHIPNPAQRGWNSKVPYKPDIYAHQRLFSEGYAKVMRNLYHISTRPFSELEISRVLALGAKASIEKGQTFTEVSTDDSLRHCKITWLDCPLLKSSLWQRVEHANASTFNVSVRNHCEMQLVTYAAVEGHHYGWHHDVQWYNTAGVDRKLSVTVQLDDEGVYSGGELEFEELQTSANLRARGTVLVFPSYLRHRVTPVTNGVRRALVAWFYGPEWR